MATLRELSADLLSGALPVDAAQPMAPRMIAEEVAPRTTFVSSFANVTQGSVCRMSSQVSYACCTVDSAWTKEACDE